MWKIRLYRERCDFYNPLAIGRTTGFALRESAEYIVPNFSSDVVVLKMKITGGLIRGTGKGMGGHDDEAEKITVYAG